MHTSGLGLGLWSVECGVLGTATCVARTAAQLLVLDRPSVLLVAGAGRHVARVGGGHSFHPGCRGQQ